MKTAMAAGSLVKTLNQDCSLFLVQDNNYNYYVLYKEMTVFYGK